MEPQVRIAALLEEALNEPINTIFDSEVYPDTTDGIIKFLSILEV